MGEDQRRDDAILADTLRAFAARPLPDGTTEPDVAPSHPAQEWHPEEEPPEPDGEPREPDGSRFDRVVGWVRWAAAPLGFFLFLSALTAYGVLRDRDGSTVSGSQSAGTPATTTAPATTATTSLPARTAPVPTTTVTPTTGPPMTASPTTVPTTPPAAAGGLRSTPAPSGSDADPDRAPAADDLRGKQYGPVCGYAPGETVDVVINGRPDGTATADAEGCVSVTR